MAMKTKSNQTVEEVKDAVVTRDNIKEVLGLCTIPQLNFLCKLFTSPESAAFASTQAEGAIAASLRKRGLIQPAARIGVHIRWMPTEGLFYREERELIKSIVNWEEKP